MLDKFRETPITWDKANRKVYEPLRASAGDNKGRKLSVQVVNGGVVEDITGASLSLYWETKDKAHKGLDAFETVNAEKGEFEIYYTTGMLSNEGTLNANLVLVDTSGRIVSEPFTITVFKGIDDDAIQSSDSFTALTQALAQVGTINNKADRDELLALESTFEQNKVSVEQQLQQTEQGLVERISQTDDRIADIILTTDLSPEKDPEVVDARLGSQTLSTQLNKMVAQTNEVKKFIADGGVPLQIEWNQGGLSGATGEIVPGQTKYCYSDVFNVEGGTRIHLNGVDGRIYEYNASTGEFIAFYYLELGFNDMDFKRTNNYRLLFGNGAVDVTPTQANDNLKIYKRVSIVSEVQARMQSEAITDGIFSRELLWRLGGLSSNTGLISGGVSYGHTNPVAFNNPIKINLVGSGRIYEYDAENGDFIGMNILEPGVTFLETNITSYYRFMYGTGQGTLNIEDAKQNLKISEVTYAYLINEQESNPLRDQSLLNFGDSIAAGAGNVYGDGGNRAKAYGKQISEKYGMTYHDKAVGGAKLSRSIDTNNICKQVDEAIASAIEAKYILIEGGTNDISSNAEQGVMTDGYGDDFDENTSIGALEYCFKRLREHYPNAKILFIRVHNMSSRDATRQKELGNAIKDVCKKWSIPVVDLYEEGGMNTNLENIRNLYCNWTYEDEVGDGTHPNTLGYTTWYVPPIEAKMKTL